jgi:hypothetical protein
MCKVEVIVVFEESSRFSAWLLVVELSKPSHETRNTWSSLLWYHTCKSLSTSRSIHLAVALT